jgi:hypothetical protein
MSESAARPHGGLIDNLYYDAMAIPAQVRLLPQGATARQRR